MEMPTPCTHCGEIFDLNDGCASDKWYRDTIICEKCSDQEQKEIEEDERWEDINIEVSNALFYLDKEVNIKNLLTQETQELIIKIAKNLKE